MINRSKGNAMETITCPNCNMGIRMSDVDHDGGSCPECGTMVTGSLLFAAGDNDEADDTDDLDVDLNPRRRRRRTSGT